MMLKAHFSLYLHSLAAWSWLALAAPLLEHDYKPIAWTRNGPVVGVYHRPQQQEHFLGIPYAEPPTGERRFTRPEPWAKKWSKPFPAGNYGPFCYGRSLNLTGFDEKDFVYPQSEDCLTINVVRPFGCEDPSGLPVLVWIYGGGFQEGGSGDQRYNQGGHQFNLRHRLNCSMDVTVQCMALARSHGSLVDLLSTRCAIELN
ncbi:hypothetical protein MRS44_018650 [Fusarium solani]|uniref:uncharacterized protein n=1 Tax=Fusarium solani TaxID=169388 RepID=UPI0032C4924B|nr:hypothetical protein MRS44_018650 [Fusarium solani]